MSLNRKQLITEESLYAQYYDRLCNVVCPNCSTVGTLYIGSTGKYVGCLACVNYFAEEDFAKKILEE